MKRLLFQALMLLLFLPANAKTTVIYGKAPSYAGKTLLLETYADEILKERDELGQAPVSADGSFRFEVDVTSPIQVFVPGDVSCSFIYLEPGATYQITIPPYQERNIQQKLDPFFAPTDCLASIVGLKKGDFNYQMMEFEDAFDFYSLKHITYGAQPDSVRKSVNEMRAMFTDLNQPFQKRFKEYRYLLLGNLSATTPHLQDSVIHRLNGLGVDDKNPAFWDAFNNIFQDFVGDRMGTIDYEVFKKIINEANQKMLFTLLRERYGITDDYLRQLVAIKVVSDLINDVNFEKLKVVAMLKAMGAGISHPDDRDLLQAIINKSLVNSIGLTAPDFEAYDVEGHAVKLSDFRGKYVYVNFCNSNLQQSLRDLQVLQRFYEVHQQSMVILSVFLYDDAETVKRLQATCKGKIVCLTTPVSDALRQVFDIQGIPSYLLLDREGKFLMTKGAQPSDELKTTLQNLLK